MNLEKLPELLHDAILVSLKEKHTEELKTLDWFTWETDFFREEKYKKASYVVIQT